MSRGSAAPSARPEAGEEEPDPSASPRWRPAPVAGLVALGSVLCGSSLLLVDAWRVESSAFGGFVLGGFLFLLAFVVVTVQVGERLKARRTPDAHAPAWAPLVATVVVAGLTIGALAADVPFEVRWGLARDDFAAAAEARAGRGEPGPPNPDSRTRIAGFDVLQVSVDRSGGVRFLISGMASFASGGFGHWPDGPPELEYRDSYETLGDGWYRWSARN